MYIKHKGKLNFNSIKVRLKHALHFVKGFFARVFQFHKGTIKTMVRFVFLIYLANFNSIKVRLKLFVLPLLLISCIFQFHKGTIKTIIFCAVTLLNHLNFNSIKVRLKLNPAFALSNIAQFQFHKGTIKTPPTCSHQTKG